MKLLKDAGLIYLIFFFGGGGTLWLLYIIIIIGLYLTGVIG